MDSDLQASMAISAAGLRVQGQRVKVIAENVANSNSTADTPGGDPYRRKVLTFQNVFDRALDADMVQVRKVVGDRSDFGLVFDPNHPAAGPDGYYKTPNVNGLIEMTDMREAQRSYEANLNVIETSRSMMMRTIDLLR
ncbi:MAG: flagellar basal body rod protein FlgC [Alphaproteobacteria bacterium]|nr:flagellar basal body rod protein FlgC [Alphaproteobacteria bacterium]